MPRKNRACDDCCGCRPYDLSQPLSYYGELPADQANYDVASQYTFVQTTGPTNTQFFSFSENPSGKDFSGVVASISPYPKPYVEFFGFTGSLTMHVLATTGGESRAGVAATMSLLDFERYPVGLPRVQQSAFGDVQPTFYIVAEATGAPANACYYPTTGITGGAVEAGAWVPDTWAIPWPNPYADSYPGTGAFGRYAIAPANVAEIPILPACDISVRTHSGGADATAGQWRHPFFVFPESMSACASRTTGTANHFSVGGQVSFAPKTISNANPTFEANGKRASHYSDLSFSHDHYEYKRAPVTGVTIGIDVAEPFPPASSTWFRLTGPIGHQNLTLFRDGVPSSVTGVTFETASNGSSEDIHGLSAYTTDEGSYKLRVSGALYTFNSSRGFYTGPYEYLITEGLLAGTTGGTPSSWYDADYAAAVSAPPQPVPQTYAFEFSWVQDFTPPSVAITCPGLATAGKDIVVRLAVSEPVRWTPTYTTPPIIRLSGQPLPLRSSSADYHEYTVPASLVSSPGTYAVTVDSGYVDSAENEGLPALAGQIVVRASTGPAHTGELATPPAPAPADFDSLQLTFTSPVTGVSASAFTFYRFAEAVPATLSLTGSARSWTVSGLRQAAMNTCGASSPTGITGAYSLKLDTAGCMYVITGPTGGMQTGPITGAIQTSWVYRKLPPAFMPAESNVVGTVVGPFNAVSVAASAEMLATGPRAGVSWDDLAPYGLSGFPALRTPIYGIPMSAFGAAREGVVQPTGATGAAGPLVDIRPLFDGWEFYSTTPQTGPVYLEMGNTFSHPPAPSPKCICTNRPPRHAQWSSGNEFTKVNISIEPEDYVTVHPTAPAMDVLSTFRMACVKGTYELGADGRDGEKLVPGTYYYGEDPAESITVGITGYSEQVRYKRTLNDDEYVVMDENPLWAVYPAQPDLSNGWLLGYWLPDAMRDYDALYTDYPPLKSWAAAADAVGFQDLPPEGSDSIENPDAAEWVIHSELDDYTGATVRDHHVVATKMQLWAAITRDVITEVSYGNLIGGGLRAGGGAGRLGAGTLSLYGRAKYRCTATNAGKDKFKWALRRIGTRFEWVTLAGGLSVQRKFHVYQVHRVVGPVVDATADFTDWKVSAFVLSLRLLETDMHDLEAGQEVTIPVKDCPEFLIGEGPPLRHPTTIRIQAVP